MLITSSSPTSDVQTSFGNASGSCTYTTPAALVRLCTNDSGKLRVTAATARIYLETINRESQQTLADLFGDRDVMRYFADGKVKSKEYIENRLTTWEERVDRGDPFHGFLVSRQSDRAPLGIAVLGYSGDPGVAEFAQALFKQHWHQGYGAEVAHALLKGLAPVLSVEHYALEGVRLREINATAHSANLASQKCMLKAGFQRAGGSDRFQTSRYLYRYAVESSICVIKKPDSSNTADAHDKV